MADWQHRSQQTGEVVFFRYTHESHYRDASEIYVWDLDKTYLDTKFENFKGLLKTVFEKAFQKRNVPGTGTLVRALRNGWLASSPSSGDFPIFFITASPPQMEKRIIEKLNLDGIYPFGLFFKDNLRNLKPGRLFRLRLQVGYKLQALLQLREQLKTDVKQILFGDDSESDALVYSLYSDACARRLSDEQLVDVLKGFRLPPAQIDRIQQLRSQTPIGDPVDRVYINLAMDTDAEYYAKFGRRTLATYNTFQVALDLLQSQRLSSQQLLRVAEDLSVNFGFTNEQLEWSLMDSFKRGVLNLETVTALVPQLKEQLILPKEFQFDEQGVPQVYSHLAKEPWVSEVVDYLHDYR